MNRQTKSQWDFGGELFPTEAMRHVLSVTELTSQVRRLLEKQIGRVWVAGEISNLRAQASGHFYFTLKDANAQLSCILFRGDCVSQREFLEDGRKVLLQGEMTVYGPRGQYQMRVVGIEFQGVGALQIAFEKLKQKLNEEGLFAAERKRSLPRFPEMIGLVTSPTGAAICDVLHVVQRRNPALKILLAPCRVQGPGAADEIATAIRRLNEAALSLPLDLILVTRGGGSLEDLWAFNEETVARAIFESRLPVVSAVGHEIDFTIIDFVADIRAATPSAAAEIITEGVFASSKFVSEIADWLEERTHQLLRRKTDLVRELERRLTRGHPKRKINQRFQYLDDLRISLHRCITHDFQKQKSAFAATQKRLGRLRPAQFLRQRRELFDSLQERLFAQTHHQLRLAGDRFANVKTRLRLLSPKEVLARGYSITTTKDGAVLRDSREAREGQKLETHLVQGKILSVVEQIETAGD